MSTEAKMRKAIVNQVLLFELKEENAEVTLRKRIFNLAEETNIVTITVKNYDGSYEINTFVHEGVHICRVIQAIRLMILGARECNWRKYQPTCYEILQRDL